MKILNFFVMHWGP